MRGTKRDAQRATGRRCRHPAGNPTDSVRAPRHRPGAVRGRQTRRLQVSRRPDTFQNDQHARTRYRHPLFPLLALLFERCELATQSSDPQSSDAFNLDIQAFVQHQERDRKPFLANEPEIDGLVSKNLQGSVG